MNQLPIYVLGLRILIRNASSDYFNHAIWMAKLNIRNEKTLFKTVFATWPLLECKVWNELIVKLFQWERLKYCADMSRVNLGLPYLCDDLLLGILCHIGSSRLWPLWKSLCGSYEYHSFRISVAPPPSHWLALLHCPYWVSPINSVSTWLLRIPIHIGIKFTSGICFF